MQATVDQSRSFRGYVPLQFFEKGDAPAGKRRRISGIASAESRDRHGDIILQKGLSFARMLEFGAINDNHEKGTANVVGKPESIKYFAKGEILPDGKAAKNNCHWFDGYFLNDPHSTRVWEKAMDLQAIGEPLGLSIEGAILWRTGHDQKIVAKAEVQNLAVTHCPVNPDTQLHAALLKSFDGLIAETRDTALGGAGGPSTVTFERIDPSEVEMAGLIELDLGPSAPGHKSLTVGHGASPGVRSGEGAAGILAPESLERKVTTLTKSEALAFVVNRYPSLRAGTASRLADVAYAIAQHIERTAA